MIIDACGVGSMPDWRDYEEVDESNTLASTADYAHRNLGGLKIPNLQQLGIANIIELAGLKPLEKPIASWGKMAELNDAKDTITGHWEMMGIKTQQPFPYYPNGFPSYIIDEIKKQFGVAGVLCNEPASGTEVINDLGDEHKRTGFPIIYTSADSVLQIACDVEVIDLETQYKWCKLAREIMRGKDEVARIIARPFALNPKYVPGSKKAAEMKYVRLGDKRHDYSILPPGKSVLDLVLEHDGRVLGFGKIQDIFAGAGVPENIHTDDNADGLDKLIKSLQEQPKNSKEVLFINLVETDSNYGHRRDPEGFAKAIEAIDQRIPEVLNALTENDVFMISADHGCDPCAAGTDHTREYVPIIAYSKGKAAQNLGLRNSFADIGATILKHFDIADSQLPIRAKTLLS